MKRKVKMDNLNIKDLDHLGIVAGIIDEMGLVALWESWCKMLLLSILLSMSS